MNAAHEMLKQEAEAWSSLRKMQNFASPSAGFQEWLLENGEECGPAIKVKGQHMKRIKECYYNSFTAIARREVDPDEWFYTEGVVLVNDLPLLIDHAWLTNRKGEVLDLTLRSQKDASYFGIPLKPAWMMLETERGGYYGLFQNPVSYNMGVVGKPITQGRAWKRKSQEACLNRCESVA